MKHISPEDQRKKIAKQERAWASLAEREGKYNLEQGIRNFNAGNKILARQYFQEARWDKWWADRRRDIADATLKKSRR
jgi:hypothetical protein